MASAYLLNLESIRDKLTEQIEGMLDDVSVAGGKPDVTGPAAVEHVAFWNSRWKALEEINRQIDEAQVAEGQQAFEVTSEMMAL